MIDSVYSTAERDKFRTRLEPGSEPGTTEIYISHRGMYEVFVSRARTRRSGSRVRRIPSWKLKCCAA